MLFIELSLESCTIARQTNTHLVSLLYSDSNILDITLQKSVQTCGALQCVYFDIDSSICLYIERYVFLFNKFDFSIEISNTYDTVWTMGKGVNDFPQLYDELIYRFIISWYCTTNFLFVSGLFHWDKSTKICLGFNIQK